MASWTSDLELAQALADLADEVTMRRFAAADLVVETKPDLTPVSDADRHVEDLVRRSVAERHPQDAIVGEEYGETEGDQTGDGSRRWIVDPIDGTKNFVRGAPSWATLLALEVDGAVQVGVVSAPALGRRWWAARGEGSWVRAGGETRRCQVSKVSSLDDAFLSYASIWTWEKRGRLQQFLDLNKRVWRTRAYGDFWSHMLVAEGAVDLSCEPEVSLWDLAALQPIVEEAGGRFTDLSGVASPGNGSVVCTNGLLHDEVLAALQLPSSAA